MTGHVLYPVRVVSMWNSYVCLHISLSFEVSLHLEGPATGQLDQGFPWFSLVPEQMLSWYPNSTLLCMLHMQPSQW
jgi:hypothetical protein